MNEAGCFTAPAFSMEKNGKNMNDQKKQKQESIVFARVDEAIRRQDAPHYFGFFDEAMQAKLEDHLKSKHANYLFEGGFAHAGRKMLCVLPDYMADDLDAFREDIVWPIAAVRFDKTFDFGHRNVLGELMAKGITRESLGDINIDDTKAQVVFDTKIERFLESDFTSLMHRSIKPHFVPFDDICDFVPKYEKLSITVASPRIDTIIDRIWHVSRSEAVSAVTRGNVRINYREVVKKNVNIKPGDIISYRGKGKAKIVSYDGNSKKGKERYTVLRYI